MPCTNNCLDKARKQALISWIGILDYANVPPTPQAIESCANETLSRSGCGRRVGQNCACNFFKRLPNDYSHIVRKEMETERMDAERLQTIIDRDDHYSCALFNGFNI
jgi:hypothetical protein